MLGVKRNSVSDLRGDSRQAGVVETALKVVLLLLLHCSLLVLNLLDQCLLVHKLWEGFLLVH